MYWVRHNGWHSPCTPSHVLCCYLCFPYSVAFLTARDQVKWRECSILPPSIPHSPTPLPLPFPRHRARVPPTRSIAHRSYEFHDVIIWGPLHSRASTQSTVYSHARSLVIHPPAACSGRQKSVSGWTNFHLITDGASDACVWLCWVSYERRRRGRGIETLLSSPSKSLNFSSQEYSKMGASTHRYASVFSPIGP